MISHHNPMKRSAQAQADAMRVARSSEILECIVDGQPVEHESRTSREMTVQLIARSRPFARAHREAVAVEPRIANLEAATEERMILDLRRTPAGVLDTAL